MRRNGRLRKFNERMVIMGVDGMEERGSNVDFLLDELEEKTAKEYGIGVTLDDAVIDLETAKQTVDILLSTANEISGTKTKQIISVLNDVSDAIDKALNMCKEADNITADYLLECGNLRAKRLGFKKHL